VGEDTCRGDGKKGETMKRILWSALAVGYLLLNVVGCKSGPSDDQKQIDYVIAHKCISDGKILNDEETVVVAGKEVTTGGDTHWYAYFCPNGLLVNIGADKPQPPAAFTVREPRRRDEK
jgi:hypothetical protein